MPLDKCTLTACIGLLSCARALCAPALLDRAQIEVEQTTRAELRSPDGKYVVTVAPASGTREAELRLQIRAEPQERTLCAYFRSGVVAWSPDSRTIVFLDYHSPEKGSIRFFRVSPMGVTEVGASADREVRQAVLRRIGPHDLVFYNLTLLDLDKQSAGIAVSVVYIRQPRRATGPTANVIMKFSINLGSFAIQARRS